MLNSMMFMVAIVVFVVISIYANGGTFEQKCSAYSGGEFETCLIRLSKGGQP